MEVQQEKCYIFISRKGPKQQTCMTNLLEKLTGQYPHLQDSSKAHILPVLVKETAIERVCLNQPKKPLTLHKAKLALEEKWNTKQSSMFASDDDTQRSHNTESRVCDILHEAANSLHYAGVSVHVVMVLDSGDVDDKDSFLSLAGAIHRLLVWHNSSVTVVNLGKLSPLAEQLTRFLSCEVVSSIEDVSVGNAGWTGAIAITDKVVDVSHVFRGFSLECEDWTTLLHQKLSPLGSESDHVSKGKDSKGKDSLDQLSQQAVCGRHIEILQEVDLASLPLMLMDDWTLTLKSPARASNDVFKDYLEGLFQDQLGLLARLRVYPDLSKLPRCGQLEWMDTCAWKEMIMNNVQGLDGLVEKEVTDTAKFLHFIILPPSSLLSKGVSCYDATVKVLLSPHELNRELVNALNKHLTMAGSQSSNVSPNDQADFSFGNLPVAQPELVAVLHESLLENPIHAESLIKAMRDKCPTLNEYKETISSHVDTETHKLPHTSAANNTACSGIIDLTAVPEYQILQSWEIVKRKFQTYPSLDSTPASSPAPARPRDSSRGFHMSDILQLLKPDGSLDLSLPPGATVLEGSKLCRVDSQTDVNVAWPDSQYLNYHDVYYYRDESDLRLEQRYAKIRDRGYFDETRSSFVSPVKKKKMKNTPLTSLSPVRRSPRKQSNTSLLMRSKSDTFQRESMFKQPCARPLARSPRKRATTSDTPTPPVVPLHRRLSLNTSVSTASDSGTPSSLVRRSPRKRTSLPLSSGPPSSASTSSSDLRLLGRKSVSSLSRVSLMGRDKSGLLRDDKMAPRKRLHSPSDFSSPPDTTDVCSNVSSLASSGSLQDTENSSRRRFNLIKRSESFTKDSGRPDRGLLDPEFSQTEPSKPLGQMKRSDRHKMKLKAIIVKSLEEKGIPQSSPLHPACLKNLFNVSMVLLKTLPNSQNLKEEMKTVVYGQVQQIINLEKRRSGIDL